MNPSQQPSDRHRRGFVAPLALIVLIFFAIMGLALIFSGSSDYSQSAHTLYAFQAQLVCQAAVEEAQAILYARVNAPATSSATQPAWKKPLFDAVKAALPATGNGEGDALTPGPSGVVLTREFQGSDDLAETRRIAGEMGATLVTARVKFHDFRPFPYRKDQGFQKPSAYYADSVFDKPDQLDKFRSYDYVGYYTVEVEARVRDRTRKLAVVRDLKVVNMSPIAREFALFQQMSLADDKYKDHREKDLNSGQGGSGSGPLRFFPRGWGRVYMRGPYVIDTEGFQEGTGGFIPVNGSEPPYKDIGTPRVMSNAFVHPPPKKDMSGLESGGDVQWYGWSLVPEPRAMLIKRIPGFSFGQRRPESTSGSVLGIAARIISPIGHLSNYLGGDPGHMLKSGGSYFHAYAPVSYREFSIIGNPRGHPDDLTLDEKELQVSVFRGKWFRFDSATPPRKLDEEPYDPHLNLPPERRDKLSGSILRPPPGNRDQRWFLSPEVNVKARVRVVQYTPPELVALPPHGYELKPYDGQGVTVPGEALVPYWLHWEPFKDPGLLDAIFDLGSSILPFAGLLNPALFTFSLLVGAGSQLAISFFTSTPPVSVVTDPNESLELKSQPTNFKIWTMAATRRYRSFNRLRSYGKPENNQRHLKLDGVIWVDDLNATQRFTYEGMGTIASRMSPGNTFAPLLTAPIVPKKDRPVKDQDPTPEERKTFDHLNIVYTADDDTATEAKQIVTIQGSPSGDFLPVDASVFSHHGVTIRGHRIILDGNLAVGVINKSKIPNNVSLHVHYPVERWRQAVDGEPARSFNDGSWHQLGISHRVAGYFDQWDS